MGCFFCGKIRYGMCAVRLCAVFWYYLIFYDSYGMHLILLYILSPLLGICPNVIGLLGLRRRLGSFLGTERKGEGVYFEGFFSFLIS